MGGRDFDADSSRGSGARSAGNPAYHLSKEPPYSLDAERSVLGSVLLQNNTFDEAVEAGVEDRDFYSDQNRRIFEVMKSLNQRNQIIDLVSLSEALKDRNWLDSVGGGSYLLDLPNSVISPGLVRQHSKIIREKAMVRRMIEACGEITSNAYEGVENVEDFLDQAEQKVFAVSDSEVNRSFMSMTDILPEMISQIEERMNRKSDVTGVPTGFTDLDKLTSGFQPGQLIIIAARPAMGKTSLVLSMAINSALKYDRVVAIFSLEMSKEELALKLVSSVARIDSKRLKVGKLIGNDTDKLFKAAQQLNNPRIQVDDSGVLTILDIRAKCRRLQAMQKRLDLVIVDYLQLMKGTSRVGGDGSREREISEISRGLKQLAKELKVPVIALSQLSRQVESRQDKRPMLSDLRESGAIEQDADIVAFVYRDDYYNEASEKKGIAEIIIGKHRAGETRTVELAWIGEYTLFENLTYDHGPGPQIAPARPDRGEPTL
jgi:replicative DNA helicase